MFIVQIQDVLNLYFEHKYINNYHLKGIFHLKQLYDIYK